MTGAKTEALRDARIHLTGCAFRPFDYLALKTEDESTLHVALCKEFECG
jgi:hypothetical protein